MKTFSFPYYITFGKLDSVSGYIECSISNEMAKRLELSAKEGGRFRLNEDSAISDIFNRVYDVIINAERAELVAQWQDEGKREAELEAYLETLVIGINYPEDLQNLPETLTKSSKQSDCEFVVVKRDLVQEFLLQKEQQQKVVLVDEGKTLYYIPKKFTGKFVVPSYIQSIEKDAFRIHEKITEIVIENGIEALEDSVFQGCKAVERIVVPESVKKIGFNAFAGCSSLKSVILSEGLEELDNTAFRACYELRELRVPGSVKELSMHINSYNNVLQDIYFEGSDTIIDDTKGGSWNRITIHAPIGSKAFLFAQEHHLVVTEL